MVFLIWMRWINFSYIYTLYIYLVIFLHPIDEQQRHLRTANSNIHHVPSSPSNSPRPGITSRLFRISRRFPRKSKSEVFRSITAHADTVLSYGILYNAVDLYVHARTHDVFPRDTHVMYVPKRIYDFDLRRTECSK